MDRWLHIGLFALAGSLLGLAQAMVFLGPGVLVAVWGASLAADAVFVAGMTATYLLARRAPGWAAVPAALVLTWVTYSVAWALAGPSVNGTAAGADAPLFVATWGWAGLLVCGFWPWVHRTLEEKAERAAAAATPAPSDEG